MRITPVSLACLISLVGLQMSRGQLAPTDWPAFRGGDAQGASEAKGLPVEWSVTEGIAWKKELPGAGGSSPIVVGDRIFLTCYSGYGEPGKRQNDISKLTRHLLCLRVSDGSIEWKQDIPAVLPEPERVTEHGYASSTPVSDGQRIYAFFGKSGVFAYDLAGKQLWKAGVGASTHKWGSGASPVLYKDLLIVNASVESEALIALNRNTGKEAWRTGEMTGAWGTPALVPVPGGRHELVLGTTGKLQGLDPSSGKPLWSCGGNRSYICSTAVWYEDRVYLAWGNRTMGVRLGGRGDVGRTHQLWSFWRSEAGSTVSSPVCSGGHLYFAESRKGIACCIDAQSGVAIYQEPLAPAAGKVYAAPLLAEGRIYYVSRQGGVFVVAAQPQYKLLAHNTLDDSTLFNASPAVAGSRLLLRSDRALYAIGR